MLRTRLFLILVPFLIAVLGIGVYAISQFSRLARNVDAAVTGYYRSILSAQAMSQSLAGMNKEIKAGVMPRWLDDELFMEYRKRFEENLALKQQLESLPGEKDLNAQLASNYQAFLKSIEVPGTARSPKDQPKQLTASSAARITVALESIRDLNYRALLETSQDIQQTTRRVTHLMVLGILAVLAVSVFTFLQMSRSILRPIQLLTRATRELGEGHPAPAVPVGSRDELGELAVAFNNMAAQLQEYRENTSEEIIRLHRTMETMLASFPDPIFVLDEQGKIELKNPPADDLAATLKLNGVLPDRLQAIARKALDSGENFLPHGFDEAVNYRVEGMEKSYLPRVVVMRTKDNALFGVAVVLYDVTRFRLLDSAKTDLVATVSHELNTPLTSVRMALHLLLEQSQGALTPKQNELLQAARNDTERLLRILNDLLDLARLEEGNAGLRKENVAPMELLRGVIDETADKVSSRGLRMNCTIEPGLPHVAVDRQRITHVFNNLIANAIKYSPVGGEILLGAARADEDGIEFSISDQGPGVPEEYHTRIFDRFFRAPGQTKTGAGLGLSIAREITLAHGGRLGVKSAPGHGSTFFVVLKAAGH